MKLDDYIRQSLNAEINSLINAGFTLEQIAKVTGEITEEINNFLKSNDSKDSGVE